MKPKTLIPFVVILALLAGVVVYQKATEEPPAPIATQLGLQPLTPEALRANAIVRLELFAGEDPQARIILEREADDWRIASQFNAPVNTDTITGFVDKMLGLKGEPRATADSEERLAAFSLSDEEAFHVQAFTAEAESPALHLLFGKSADFRTVFLRRADDSQVYVEATNLRREAGVGDPGADTIPKPNKWLQTNLLELDKDMIEHVALQYPDKSLAFRRHEVAAPETEDAAAEDIEDDGALFTPEVEDISYEWRLAEGGHADRFTESEFQTLLNRFAPLTITNVVDPELKADWGFDPPRYAAEVTLEDGTEITLYGGREKPGGDSYVQLAGAEPPLIYQISKFNFEQLFPQGSKLFSLPAFEIAEDLVLGIEINRPTGRILLQRDEDVWTVQEPQLALETQKPALDNLVAAVTSLAPVDYVDSQADVGAFDTTVTVFLGEQDTRTIHLGQPSQHIDGQYVRFDDAPEVFVLSRADVEKLLPPARDLYTLSVLDFDVNEISRISVMSEDTQLQLVRDAEDDFLWQSVINGQTGEAMFNDVQEFIYTLNAFQVDDFILDQSPETLTPEVTIEIAEKDDTLVLLQIGPEVDGLHHAVISGMPYVFAVKPMELLRIDADLKMFVPMDEQEAMPSSEMPDEEAVEEEAATTAPVDTPEIRVTQPVEIVDHEIDPEVDVTPEILEIEMDATPQTEVIIETPSEQ